MKRLTVFFIAFFLLDIRRLFAIIEKKINTYQFFVCLAAV